METDQWTKTINETDLKEGVPVPCKVGTKEIILIRVGHRILACGGKCPHYGGPLAEGVNTNHSITCPWHNSCFDLTTGNLILPPALDHLPSYPVKVEDGDVYVGKAMITPFPKIIEKDRRTFVIVGAGAAGNAAAETLRREGFSGRIVMITPETDRPYDRPNLSKDYLAGTAQPEWIPLRSEKFYEIHQIEILFNHRVSKVNPSKRVVSLASGGELPYDRLLLATGGIPRRPNIPGIGLEGAFLLRSLANAKSIISAFANGKTAVIIGGGFIGMEGAASFTKRGIEVHVVTHEKYPMMRVFGERIGRYLQSLHEKHGVVFHPEVSVKEILGVHRVENVVLSDGSRIEADMVLAGVGIIPAVDYLETTGLIEDGAVPVDSQLQTKIEGIFAAGDIAVVPTPPHGEKIRCEHWVVAERLGQHAARAMLGNEAPYDEIPFFWTRQYDESLKYIGFAKDYDHIAYRGKVEEGQFLAGFYQNGMLKAVAGLHRDKEIIHLTQMMKARATLPAEQFQDEKIDLMEFAVHL
jgi:NADPH-dependent 2,4-dienoyl-CoA reductase/sulfur reductase-like enzyme/nitrite reductase/ring-hydroxylating ferredoxin subunit